MFLKAWLIHFNSQHFKCSSWKLKWFVFLCSSPEVHDFQHRGPIGKISQPKHVKIFVGLHTYVEYNSFYVKHSLKKTYSKIATVTNLHMKLWSQWRWCLRPFCVSKCDFFCVFELVYSVCEVNVSRYINGRRHINIGR